MPTPLTAAAILDEHLTDWRQLGRGLEAGFTCESYAAAGAFAARVAELADEQGHHPAISLTYPGTVHVVTTSHDARGVTARDIELARAISRVYAVAGGDDADPHGSTMVEIAVDALDIDRVRPFWLALLAYVEEPPRVPGDTVRAIADPGHRLPTLWFQQMSEPRTERNRIHLDVHVPADVADARIAAAVAAGGRVVSDADARAFWVLADPEGNEACICTNEDRD